MGVGKGGGVRTEGLGSWRIRATEINVDGTANWQKGMAEGVKMEVSGKLAKTKDKRNKDGRGEEISRALVWARAGA